MQIDICIDYYTWQITVIIGRNITWCYDSIGYGAQNPGNLGPLLQTRINLNPSMDKLSHV